MPLLTNRAKMTITSVAGSGTGTLTLNAADPGFRRLPRQEFLTAILFGMF